MPARRLASRASFLAGGLTAGLVIVYLALISSQGEGLSTRVTFVAGWLAVAAVFFLAGAFTPGAPRRSLLAGIGSSLLVPLAVAAGFSIGGAIFVLAVIGGAAASVAAHEGGIGPWRRAAAAILLVGAASGLLLIGFLLTV
jgi:hypothetical protein